MIKVFESVLVIDLIHQTNVLILISIINATHLHYQTLGINFATDANVFTFLCFTWYALHTRSKGSDA